MPARTYRYFFLTIGVLLITGYFLLLRKSDSREICADGSVPLRLSVVGDLLLGGGKAWQQIVGDGYGSAIFKGYSDVLEQSDLIFANFEGIITEREKARQKGLPVEFSLRTDPSGIRFLEQFKPLVLSFANNHSADFGYEAIEDTLGLLSGTEGVTSVGIGRNREDALRPYIFSTSGTRIAFLAFTDLLPEDYYASGTGTGVAKLTADNLREAIAFARQDSDVVVVSLHTAEDVGSPFSFWPDQHQRSLSRLAIDYGADVVVGQHPHGLQWAGYYRSKLIFYSLGLFLYDPAASQRSFSNQALSYATQFRGGGILTLAVCKNGVLGFTLEPVKMRYEKDGLQLAAASLPKRLLTMLNVISIAIVQKLAVF